MTFRPQILVFAVCLTAVGAARAADSQPTPPNVLMIGDSISMGYQQPLEQLLAGRARVVHNPGNAQHSAYGLAHLDEWLGNTKWEIIHFNFGLHDLKYVDADGNNTRSTETGHIQIPLDDYRKNLEAIVARLKQTGAKLVFATTTPFPDQPEGPLRHIADVERYNRVALEVMKANAIEVDDLHGFALPRLKEFQQPNNVHFTPEGSRALAGQVASHLLKALDKGRDQRP